MFFYILASFLRAPRMKLKSSCFLHHPNDHLINWELMPLEEWFTDERPHAWAFLMHLHAQLSCEPHETEFTPLRPQDLPQDLFSWELFPFEAEIYLFEAPCAETWWTDLGTFVSSAIKFTSLMPHELSYNQLSWELCVWKQKFVYEAPWTSRWPIQQGAFTCWGRNSQVSDPMSSAITNSAWSLHLMRQKLTVLRSIPKKATNQNSWRPSLIG